MATLTPLTVGNAATPSGWDSATNGALGDDSDLTYGYDATNTDQTVVQGWELANVDADFGTILTLSVVLRYGWSADPAGASVWELAASPGTQGLMCRIISGATILAAADSGGTFEEVVAVAADDATIRDSSSVPFTYVNTAATKTTWDAAVVEIQISRNRIKGGSTDQQRVYEADFTGTYTPSLTETNAPAELASGTGTSLAAKGSVGTLPGIGSATGAAFDTTVTATPFRTGAAEVASATGAAFDTTVASFPLRTGAAEVASATGTAPDQTASVATVAGVASATGAAFDTTVTTLTTTDAAAELASATGTANDTSVQVATFAEVASATGAAFDTTVQTFPAADANAEAATGTVTAQAPTASTGAVETATSGTGTAYDTTVTSTPFRTGSAEAATAIAAAYDPTGAVAVFAGLASATGTAYDATVTTVTGTTANAEVAAAVGAAYDAFIANAATAEAASATGTAYDATVSTLTAAAGGLVGSSRGSHRWLVPIDRLRKDDEDDFWDDIIDLLL